MIYEEANDIGSVRVISLRCQLGRTVRWPPTTSRGVISPQLPIYFQPFIEVITPFTTGRGPPCMITSFHKTRNKRATSSIITTTTSEIPPEMDSTFTFRICEQDHPQRLWLLRFRLCLCIGCNMVNLHMSMALKWLTGCNMAVILLCQ